MTWGEMKDAPKDGTPVLLRVETEYGPSELDGPHAFLKPGTWPPRWYRLRDMAEVAVLPCGFQLITPTDLFGGA